MTRMGTDGRLNYYQQTAKQVIAELRSHNYGLTNPEAKRRLTQNGANALPYGAPHTPLSDMLGQANTWWFGLLLLGVAVSWWQQDGKLAVLFTGVAAVVIFVGAWRERHVGSLRHNLGTLLPATAMVRRNGADVLIPVQQLVIGDLIVLQPRTRIAADVRLIEADGLLTDDSQLHSGHALVHKFTHALRAVTPLSKRHNLGFAGTEVVSGTGLGVVVATGAQTELGQLLSLTQATLPKRSLVQQRLSDQTNRIGLVLLTLTLGLVLVGMLGGLSLHIVQSLALSLTAALAPVGFLLGISALLAVITKQAKKSGVQFQSVSAIDRLGKIDTALLDDADFLIYPAASVQQILIGKKTYSITGTGYKPEGTIQAADKKPASPKTLRELSLFFEAAVLTNQAKLLPPDANQTDWHIAGTANDGALIALAAKAGYHADDIRASHQLLQQFPYDHSRQMGSWLYKYDHRTLAFVQGDAATVLGNITHIWDGGHTRAASAADKKRLTDYIHAQTATGGHVAALAYAVIDSEQTGKQRSAIVEKELTLLGLATIGWPLKLEVPEAIQTLLNDGITPSLFTSHTLQTAAAIAHRFGMSNTTHLDAAALNKLDDAQLFERVREGGLIITHATSRDRLRLVDVLQRGGSSVLITGRSLGDIPAMHHASLSAVSSTAHGAVQDEADLILQQGNLHALTRQLNRSRHSITNIANALQAAFTDGFALVLLVLVGIGLYLAQHVPVALSPTIILGIIILLQPVLVASLSTDNLSTKPSTTSLDTTGSRVFLSLVSALLGVTVFLSFFARTGLSPSYIDNSSLIYAQAATTTLVSLAFFSWINLLFIRANHTRSLRSPCLWHNRRLFGALGISLLLLVCLVYVPWLQTVFGTAALSATDWLSSISIAVVYAGIRWMVRTERRHTRGAIIALHQQVHGSNSKAKV